MAHPHWPALDPYIVDTLMRDLVGHDQRASSFLVYLWLWRQSAEAPAAGVRVSLQKLATCTGLSRSTVQAALAHLAERELIVTRRSSPTAVPLHVIQRPWARRGGR